MKPKPNISEVPPHADEVEMAVLGAMLLSEDAVYKAREILQPEHFFAEKHRIIYETIIALYDNNVRPDLITLSEKLNELKLLESIGGTYYLTELNAKTPTAANIETHAQIVYQYYVKRSAIRIGQELMIKGFDAAQDCFDTLDNGINQLDELRLNARTDEIEPKHLAMIYLKELEERIANFHAGKENGIMTGFKQLDDWTGGFFPGDFIVIGADTSTGKTALLHSLIRKWCFFDRKAVGYIAMEGVTNTTINRQVSIGTGIPSAALRRGAITKEEMKEITKSVIDYSKTKFYIEHLQMLKNTEILTKCKILKNKYKVDLIAFDYLQLVKGTGKESRERDIAETTEAMFKASGYLKLPIIGAAQLNREVASRANKRPVISDLRESGTIEQSARIMLLIYRPEKYGMKTFGEGKFQGVECQGKAEIILAKNGEGEIGSFLVNFNATRSYFTDIDYYQEEPRMQYFNEPREREDVGF